MARSGVVIVSNRLPVTVKEQDGKVFAERAIGGVATTLDAVAKRYQARWVGWSGLPTVLSEAELAKAQLPDDLIPVQAEPELIHRYYDRFANGVLWPNLHSMPASFTPDAKDWAAFEEMNRRFAEAIKRTIRSQDELIWVHDYHLMLLPRYLREAGLKNRIGFFLHTPFPSPEFAAGLPYARQLLSGLAAADLLGLQAQRDVDNFLQSLEAVGISGQPGLVRALPIGTDYQAYRAAPSRPAVRQLIQDVRSRTQGKRVIFSLSRLDYTKGIVHQLRAVERLLAALPNREEFVYKLVVAPSREQLGEYKVLKDQIEQAVNDVNARLGNVRWQPVDYSYENLGFEDVVAWYNAADVLLLLPKMDGMNLIAKEYIAAREDEGILVLSTAMGSVFQLTQALLVEADDTGAAVAALKRALDMPEVERSARWQALRSTVRDQDVFWWAESFLSALQSNKSIV